MRRATVLDKKLDALLAGHDPAPGDEMAADLAFMLDELQAAFPAVVVSEQVEDAHIARMVEAAESVAPVVTAPMAPARSSVLDRMRAGLSRRVAAASLAFTAAFGGAAYAGVLPAPVQRAVANAAGAVGLELPKPGDDDGRAVAGDPEDRDDRDPVEVTAGRVDDDPPRGGAVVKRDVEPADDRSGDGAGSRGDDSDEDGGQRDGRDDDDDDDDADDFDDDGRDDRSTDGRGTDVDDDDDDVEYEAPETDDSDRDDDPIEPDDDGDEEESSFDSGDRDSSEDDFDVDADEVEESSDD